MKKSDLLGEKCENNEDVEYIDYDNNELEVSTTLRNCRSALLNRRQELLRDERTREKIGKITQ